MTAERRLTADPDLSVFRSAGPPTTWAERARLVRTRFPSTEGFDWKKAFDRDIELMGRILQDVLKADQAVPGRPGPRPALDPARAMPVLDKWMGKDPLGRPYTCLPFPAAFQLLAGDRSLRHVARRADLPPTQVFRLLRGDIKPSIEMMMGIADRFSKEPSWFLEYRLGAITAVLMARLESAPERSIHLYEALWQ